VGLAGQLNATLFRSVFGLAGQQDPTLLAPFGSVLGLAWQPDPTALGPATKSNPIAFGKVGNTPQLQFLTKNTTKKCPPLQYL
jgi:hypothetical protein